LYDVAAVLTPTAVRQADASKVTLSWAMPAGTSLGQTWVYARDVGVANWTLLGKTRSLTYQDTKATAGVEREYRLFQVNNLGQGPETSVTTAPSIR
jgi:hypothetical protein